MSQAEQGGQIGVTLLAFWFEPATRKLEDVEAAARMFDFSVGLVYSAQVTQMFNK